MRYNSMAERTGESAGILLAGNLDFRWGWINLFNMVMVAALLLPNVLYALKRRGVRNLCENRIMNALEQIGRYGSMLFMILCIEEGGFGFPSVFTLLCYCFGNLFLLLAYWNCWIVYFRITGVRIFGKSQGPAAVFIAGKRKAGQTVAVRWMLVFFPCGIFLLCGITLQYLPLIISAVIFMIGHTFVSYDNIRKSSVEIHDS